MSQHPTANEIGLLWFEKVWNERDNAKARELMAPDAIGYLEGGAEVVGPDSFLEFQSEFLRAIPDMRLKVLNTLSDDNSVCVQWSAQGTHSGPGLGLQPTGKKVAFRGVTWFEVKDGKVVNGRDFWNMEGLLQKMSGAVTK